MSAGEWGQQRITGRRQGQTHAMCKGGIEVIWHVQRSEYVKTQKERAWHTHTLTHQCAHVGTHTQTHTHAFIHSLHGYKGLSNWQQEVEWPINIHAWQSTLFTKIFNSNYATKIIRRGRSFRYINNGKGPTTDPLELHILMHTSWRKPYDIISTLWFLDAFTKL